MAPFIEFALFIHEDHGMQLKAPEKQVDLELFMFLNCDSRSIYYLSTASHEWSLLCSFRGVLSEGQTKIPCLGLVITAVSVDEEDEM